MLVCTGLPVIYIVSCSWTGWPLCIGIIDKYQRVWWCLHTWTVSLPSEIFAAVSSGAGPA